MKRAVWFVVLAALLALSMVFVAGCSHKAVKTDEGLTNQTTPPPVSTPPATTPPADTTSGRVGDEGPSGYPDVYFAYDDASLGDEARGVLSKTGAKLSKNADKVEVQGHCDERGSVEYNLALGEKRANAVKDYLVSYGVGSARLTTVSLGKERPVDPGHDESAWAKNRRAHFVTR